MRKCGDDIDRRERPVYQEDRPHFSAHEPVKITAVAPVSAEKESFLNVTIFCSPLIQEPTV